MTIANSPLLSSTDSSTDITPCQLLIALPKLSDPNFSQSITLLCEHSETGALGLIVNRPSNNTLGEMLEQLNLPCPDHLLHRCVYQGGPVGHERGFVLHSDTSQWRNTVALEYQNSNGTASPLKLTTSRDILEAIGNNQGPDSFMLVFGYASWSAGQLEQEMDKNAWLSTAAGPDILFDTPPKDRWQKAVQSLSFDLSQLSPTVGHC